MQVTLLGHETFIINTVETLLIKKLPWKIFKIPEKN